MKIVEGDEVLVPTFEIFGDVDFDDLTGEEYTDALFGGNDFHFPSLANVKGKKYNIVPSYSPPRGTKPA